MAISSEYQLLPSKLHAALLTSPATKVLCATHMIATGGLTLSQTRVEAAIDLIIADLFDTLVLSVADYATLLLRHQSADASAALRVLRGSAHIIALRVELAQNESLVANATSEWSGLTGGQQAALPNIFAAGQAGIAWLNDQSAYLLAQIQKLERAR